MNMSRSLIAPFATVLTESLAAIGSQWKFAIQSSLEPQDRIANLFIPSYFELVTFDIKNPRPSSAGLSLQTFNVDSLDT